MASSASNRVFNVARRRVIDEGFEATKTTDENGFPCLNIAGRGRYHIVAEGDRGYYWKGEKSGKLSDGFTCDLYMSDGEEIADALIYLLDTENGN
jgi:hypothetical protein